MRRTSPAAYPAKRHSLVLEQLQQLCERQAPMTDAVLFLRRQLRGGPAQILQKEIRVVAKAAAAARRARDLAVPLRFRHQRLGVARPAHQHQHADVVGKAILVSRHLREKFSIVSFIGFRFASVTRRMNPRSSAERVHAKARVVGERGQPRREGGMTRLGEGVLEKGLVGFLGFGDAEFRLRDDARAEGLEELLDLRLLARIARGKNDALHKPSARRCCATSSAMPRPAMASSWSSSARAKGSPSAVPCTSTKRPAPVITTFMSVWQAESSG